MNRDKNHPPADTDMSAGAPEAERQAKIKKLTRRRSKLTAEEASLPCSMFRGLVDAHHKLVWDYLLAIHLRPCLRRHAHF